MLRNQRLQTLPLDLLATTPTVQSSETKQQAVDKTPAGEKIPERKKHQSRSKNKKRAMNLLIQTFILIPNYSKNGNSLTQLSAILRACKDLVLLKQQLDRRQRLIQFHLKELAAHP